MDDSDGGQVRKSGIVQIFVQFRDTLVDSLAEKIDLRAYGQGFTHLHLALGGLVYLFGRIGRGIFDDLKVGDVDLRA